MQKRPNAYEQQSKKNFASVASRLKKESARRIRELRAALAIDNQSAFADRLGVSQQAISFWENGSKLPSSEMFILLGNLAASCAGVDALWFWQQAGLDPIAAKRLIPDLENRIEEAFNNLRGKVLRDLPNKLLNMPLCNSTLRRAIDDLPNDLPLGASPLSLLYVPLLRSAKYSNQPSFAPTEEIERRYPVWPSISRHPEKLCCLRVHLSEIEEKGENFLASILLPVRVGHKEYFPGDFIQLSEHEFKTLLASRVVAVPTPFSHGSFIAVVDSSLTDILSLYGRIVLVECNNRLELAWPDYLYLGNGKYSNTLRLLSSTEKRIDGSRIIGAVVGLFMEEKSERSVKVRSAINSPKGKADGKKKP